VWFRLSSEQETRIFGTRISYQKTERVQAFGGYGKKTREQKLSGKSGLRKRRLSRKAGFFLAEKLILKENEGGNPGILEILPKNFSNLLRVLP
jgi:hypothetical protein